MSSTKHHLLITVLTLGVLLVACGNSEPVVDESTIEARIKRLEVMTRPGGIKPVICEIACSDAYDVNSDLDGLKKCRQFCESLDVEETKLWNAATTAFQLDNSIEFSESTTKPTAEPTNTPVPTATPLSTPTSTPVPIAIPLPTAAQLPCTTPSQRAWAIDVYVIVESIAGYDSQIQDELDKSLGTSALPRITPQLTRLWEWRNEAHRNLIDLPPPDGLEEVDRLVERSAQLALEAYALKWQGWTSIDWT